MTTSRPKTLRELSGLPMTPPSLADAVLVVIDAQREYLDGLLPLDGVAAALDKIERLLTRSRELHGKVVHVVHQGRAGGTFDPDQGGRIIGQVAPFDGEPVISKTLPNAFTAAEFRTAIDGFGERPLVFAGFMTHMCISATTRAALDAGLAATVASDACATRALPSATNGSVIAAASVHDIALSEIADRFAIVETTDTICA